MLERALMSDSDMLEADDLDAVMPSSAAGVTESGQPAPGGHGGGRWRRPSGRRLTGTAQRPGNKAEAAQLFGISRAALYERWPPWASMRSWRELSAIPGLPCLAGQTDGTYHQASWFSKFILFNELNVLAHPVRGLWLYNNSWKETFIGFF